MTLYLFAPVCYTGASPISPYYRCPCHIESCVLLTGHWPRFLSLGQLCSFLAFAQSRYEDNYFTIGSGKSVWKELKVSGPIPIPRTFHSSSSVVEGDDGESSLVVFSGGESGMSPVGDQNTYLFCPSKCEYKHCVCHMIVYGYFLKVYDRALNHGEHLILDIYYMYPFPCEHCSIFG